MAISRHDRATNSLPDYINRNDYAGSMQFRQRNAHPARERYQRCQLEKSELCSIHEAVKEFPCPQHLGIALSPQGREAVGDKQGYATCQCAVRGDLENGFCNRNRRVKKTLDPWRRSATRNKQKRTLGAFLAPVQWIRSHPKITLGVLILLLLLLLALGVSWAIVSGRSCGETPVTPVTPGTPLLLACPHGWVGHRGICYFLSRDQLSWDQAQARCSELGASLAVLQDWEMELLSCLTRNEDLWVGLCRWGRELQWVDGSSFSSSVPVLGNARCVYLSNGGLRSMSCSQHLPFICSRPQIRV